MGVFRPRLPATKEPFARIVEDRFPADQLGYTRGISELGPDYNNAQTMHMQ